MLGLIRSFAGARVFLAGAGPGGGELSDVSDAKGHYVLHGAPSGTHLVRAAMAASSYVGDSAQVTTAVGNAATRDFHLTAVADGLPVTLLGFTVEVQGYRKSGQGAVLSGHLVSLPTNSDFAPTESGRTLQFDSVLVGGGGGNAVPVGGSVHLTDSDLPLVLFGKYLVRQQQHGGIDVTDQGGGQGAIKGPVALLPGSFAVTSAELVFLDSLHLLDPGASGAARTRIATLAAGGVSTAPAAGYNVGTVQGGDAKLTVDGFPADAAASGSHLTADALHLDATLHTAIPGLADLAIHVGNLTVTPGTGAGAGLQDAKGDQPLSLTLGQWTLNAPTWSLGKGHLALVQGAVRVPMTAGKPASVIDFPFTGMSVTPTSLEGGHFGGGPILLGGFVPLSVAGDISFLRDTPTSPWKLFGGGGQIAALPGMAAGDEIRVQSWRFMSNGEKHFSMEPGGHVQLYHTGDMALSTMGITESTVSFAGGLDLHIPGLAPQAAVIDYTRPVGSAPPVFKFNPIDIAPFDIGGPLVSVHQGTLDASGFHGDGTVEVPQKFVVKSAFLRSPLGPAEKVQALPQSGATLDVGQIAISSLQGGAKVAGGKWATNYQGHLDVGGQVSGDLAIGVQGTDVNAGTGGLAVKNIPTPFGNMAITMNFPKQRLEGSVEMEKDIAAGAHVKGTSEMVISGDPAQRYWYLFTGAGFALKTPHLSGSAALLIGDATLDADLLGRFRKYGTRDVPAVFHTVHGFFLEGAASIPVPVCPNGTFDIGVADVEVWCNVTGDVRLGASFDKANTYLIGIGAGDRCRGEGWHRDGAVCARVRGGQGAPRWRGCLSQRRGVVCPRPGIDRPARQRVVRGRPRRHLSRRQQEHQHRTRGRGPAGIRLGGGDRATYQSVVQVNTVARAAFAMSLMVLGAAPAALHAQRRGRNRHHRLRQSTGGVRLVEGNGGVAGPSGGWRGGAPTGACTTRRPMGEGGRCQRGARWGAILRPARLGHRPCGCACPAADQRGGGVGADRQARHRPARCRPS